MTSKRSLKTNHKTDSGSVNGSGNSNMHPSPFMADSQQNEEFLKHQLVELRLSETMESLRSVTSLYNSLLKDFRCLSDKYATTKLCALETIWNYCPKHSDEFKSMPYEDKYLIETNANIGAYTILTSIGEGQFSTVKKCTKQIVIKDPVFSSHPIDGRNTPSSVSNDIVIEHEYAVKHIVKDKIRNIEEVVRIENEITTLKLLSPHPNIIRYYESMHGTESLYIVTELLPLDLFDFNDANHSKFDDNLIGVIIREAAQGLAHMHNNYIAHMDVKPENILLGFGQCDVGHTTNGGLNTALQVKLCDFGLSGKMSKSSSVLTDFCGSPGFFAPEVFLKSKFDGYKADVFSLACVALEMLVPQPFFNANWIRTYEIMKKSESALLGKYICSAIDIVLNDIKAKHSHAVHACMVNMLVLAPTQRPSIYDILGINDAKYNDMSVGGNAAQSVSTNPHRKHNSCNMNPKSPSRVIKSSQIVNANFNGPATAEVSAGNPKIEHDRERKQKPDAPFLWIQKSDMKLAVEKIRNFAVRRSSAINPADIKQLKQKEAESGIVVEVNNDKDVVVVVGARKQSKALLNFHLTDLQNGASVLNSPSTPTRPNVDKYSISHTDSPKSSIHRMQSVSTGSNEGLSHAQGCLDSKEIVHCCINNFPKFQEEESETIQLPLHLKHSEKDIEKAMQIRNTPVRYIPPTSSTQGYENGVENAVCALSPRSGRSMHSPDKVSTYGMSNGCDPNTPTTSTSVSPSNYPCSGYSGVNNNCGSAYSGADSRGVGHSIGNDMHGIGAFGMGNTDAKSPWNDILSKFHKNTTKNMQNDEKPSTPCGNLHNSALSILNGNTPERRKGTHNLFAVDISALANGKSKPKQQLKDIPRYMTAAKPNEVHVTTKAHKISLNVISNRHDK